ncbi:hypothetical protein BDN72DRAFT_138869 [Pluteus cervinus]|uniref:Uncharacterized protein n=1 Tax=Pluteus cervinus TaxID=181527 RepID=A0ACD3B725_9AGAR|nr:hypothetical protein BDN72DRAFT_138869 [Pluteus cervinus]
MDYSLFGPPSELINIAAFIAPTGTRSEVLHEQDSSVDCSVFDIREELNVLWNTPALSAHITKKFEHTISTLHSASNPTKKKRPRLPDPDNYPEEVTTLQGKLDVSSLLSARLGATAVPFLRNPKNTDYNTLLHPKIWSDGEVSPGHHAIITFSVYNRVPWDTSLVARISQHEILSFRTLSDLYRLLPCPYKDSLQTDKPLNTGPSPSQFVICVEGVAYGDSYDKKLVDHLGNMSKSKKPLRKGTFGVDETQLASLSLRIGQPYWLVHQGNCEHFIVLDQISIASEERTAHMQTLHISPTLLDLCRACTKVPAAWTILNDIRLGESPCPLCGPCWRNMGTSEDPTVVPIPLPSYDIT